MDHPDSKTNPNTMLLDKRLDGDLVASLDDWQRSAINDALEQHKWSNEHPLNIRLSLPLFGPRYYLTIVGGREKRNAARRLDEQASHPVRTFFNMLFAIGVVAGATVVMLLFLALYSSIIEF